MTIPSQIVPPPYSPQMETFPCEFSNYSCRFERAALDSIYPTASPTSSTQTPLYPHFTSFLTFLADSPATSTPLPPHLPSPHYLVRSTRQSHHSIARIEFDGIPPFPDSPLQSHPSGHSFKANSIRSPPTSQLQTPAFRPSTSRTHPPNTSFDRPR